jgi:hypothetical protein
MRSVLTCLLLAAAPLAAAQSPPIPSTTVPNAGCADCGVIRSVRTVVKKEPLAAADQAKPSGLVATVPLGGGKMQVGSSTKLGRDVEHTSTVYELIVRYDNGRYTTMTLDDPGDWKEGDRVRVDKGKLLPR